MGDEEFFTPFMLNTLFDLSFIITFSSPHTTTIPVTMLYIADGLANGFEAEIYMSLLKGAILEIVKIGFIFPSKSKYVGFVSSLVS